MVFQSFIIHTKCRSHKNESQRDSKRMRPLTWFIQPEDPYNNNYVTRKHSVLGGMFTVNEVANKASQHTLEWSNTTVQNWTRNITDGLSSIYSNFTSETTGVNHTNSRGGGNEWHPLTRKVTTRFSTQTLLLRRLHSVSQLGNMTCSWLGKRPKFRVVDF